MYRFGKPTKQINLVAGLVIALVVAVILGGIYGVFIRKAGDQSLKNNTPVIKKINGNSTPVIGIKEPVFSLELPGKWQETARDNMPGYQTIQWNYMAKDSPGRWFRIYIDTIPADFAVNYLLPVNATGRRLAIGQMSDNCVTFTQSQTSNINRDVSTPNSSAAVAARWQQVNFMCEASHVSHQVVGTGSGEGGNAVTLTGPEHGRHKFFFVYEDDSYHPDYSVFMSILSSFTAR